MNLGMTARFPRAYHLTLISFWWLSWLSPDSPFCRNTPVPKAMCTWHYNHFSNSTEITRTLIRSRVVSCVFKRDPLKAQNFGPYFHWSIQVLQSNPFMLSTCFWGCCPLSWPFRYLPGFWWGLEYTDVACSNSPSFFSSSPSCGWMYLPHVTKIQIYWVLRWGAALTGRHPSSYLWPIDSEGTYLQQSGRYSRACVTSQQTSTMEEGSEEMDKSNEFSKECKEWPPSAVKQTELISAQGGGNLCFQSTAVPVGHQVM